MKVLVHEWVTGGGVSGAAMPESWAAEGRAMRRAIADDFHDAGAEVVMTLDPRFADEGEGGPWEAVLVGPGEEDDALGRLSAACDYTALIAPETGGVLEAKARAVVRSGGTSLGSTPEAIALTADKERFGAHLTRQGIPTPPTVRLGSDLPRAFPYPAVVKPIDGAGSVATYFVEGPDDGPFEAAPGGMLIQPYRAGQAMSASYLVGRDGAVHLLGVGWQRVAIRDGRFAYEGGRLPAPAGLGGGEPLWAVRSVPGLCGFVGVDFVVEAGTGRAQVIEINPRPTTSYVGLRRLYPPGAIARAWLAAVRGGGVTAWEAPSGPGFVAFRPDGSTDWETGGDG